MFGWGHVGYHLLLNTIQTIHAAAQLAVIILHISVSMIFNVAQPCHLRPVFLEVPDHHKAGSKRTVDEVLQGLPSSLGGFVLVLVCVCALVF